MRLGIVIAAVLAGGAAQAQLPSTTSLPATAPAARQWGRATAGLALSVRPAGEWVFGRALRLDPALRNTGSVAGTLPQPAKLFGYLILAQGREAHYTEKVFHARAAARWPKELSPGGLLELPAVDVSKLKAFQYRPGLKLIGGYPAEVVAGKPTRPPAAGTVGEVLRPGPVRIRHLVYMDRESEGAVFLTSNTLKLDVFVSHFAALAPKDKQRLLDDLAERMRRDAWSAKVAHRHAVQIGAAAVPTLGSIIKDARAESFAQMWAAAALADIGGKDVVADLIDCLTHPTPGVRYASAYHGLKLRSSEFDEAVTRRAVGGNDPMVTAWTIMGYLKFRKAVPEGLLKAGLESPQWRVRAAVVETVARGAPDQSHAPILRRLVLDEYPPIRLTAARALRGLSDRSAETIDALVRALALPGENARHAVAEALCQLTGKDWRYGPSYPTGKKAEVLRKWQQWWDRSRSDYRATERGEQPAGAASE